MRATVILIAAFLLASCDSLMARDSDSFEQGTTTQAKFDADNRDCQKEADDYLSYDLQGMGGTGYHRSRVYNQKYGDCMHRRGYGDHGWVKNWIPGLP